MGKDEIAHFEQFHLYPRCFPEAFFFNVLKRIYMEEWVNSFPNDKFYTVPNSKLWQTTILDMMKMTKFSKQVEKTVGKGEIDGYEQSLLFPQCF